MSATTGGPIVWRVVLAGGPRDGERITVPGPGTRRLELGASPTLLPDVDPLAASLGEKALYVVFGPYDITEDNGEQTVYEAVATYQAPPG